MLKRLEAKEEIKKTHERNYEEWGKPFLSLPQYLKREECLSQTAHSKKYLNTWAYYLNNEVFAQCETYTRPIHCYFGSSNDYKRLENGYCQSIASVFVEEKNRGNGYAQKLIVSLKEDMKKQKKVICSQLFSDVGPKFYYRPDLNPELDWKVYSPYELYIDTTKSETLASLKNPKTKRIDDDLIAAIIEKEVEREKEMVKKYFDKVETKSLLFILPLTKEILEWHHTKENYYYSQLNKKNTETLDYGIYLDDSHWMILLRDFAHKTLYCLKHEVVEEEKAKTLIDHLVEEAKKFELTKILIWNPKSILKQFGEYRKRTKDSLPSMSIFWNNTKQLTDLDPDSQVEWTNIEKFCWV